MEPKRNEQQLQEQEKRVKKEQSRLERLFKDIPPGKMKVAEGLIIQAARLRVLLDDAWDDIQENGDYELFTQSDSTPSYERERPVAKHFNQRDGAYQKIIMQLSKMVPEEKTDEVTEKKGLLE